MFRNKKTQKVNAIDGDGKKATSSYGKMKRKFSVQKEEMELKFAVQMEEMKGLDVVVQQLRRELTGAHNRNEELEAVVRDVLAVSNEQLKAVVSGLVRDYDPEGVITTAMSSYQVGKSKQTILEGNNAYLTSLIVEERQKMQELKRENEELKEGSKAFRILTQELRENITILSNANDAQTSKLELVETTLNTYEVARVGERKLDSFIKQAVLRAFGWKQATADPTMLRAACGFWKGSLECMECGNGRTSLKRRMDIWLHLTNHGFNGRVHDVLERNFMARNKFNVVELCRKSDVESKFNSCALQSVAECQPGKAKYDRGLLCSGTTLRRMQQRVHNLAEKLGFSSLPQAEKGNVWCWGDANGNFETGVNRYVYEIYVKARSSLVTKDKPWIVPLTGDLARVNYRGKAITMAGPKQADPRLPCQGKTMKTSNQSREMYTPAIAGYVDEGHVMKYFDAMVASFREIESRGFCVVNGERHEVFIDVVVVADMAYLHKYLKRGGGSHACTNFCFFCSVNKKYRAEGYPGGCMACRRRGTVYDANTGAQICRHHDVCDSKFLEWQKERLQYLTEVVKPRIPISARPFYEGVDGLRAECLKLCRNVKEIEFVTKKKSIAQLEKWLKADSRTRGMRHALVLILQMLSFHIDFNITTEGCDLSCNLHTGVRICRLNIVEEDLRLRNIPHAAMQASEKRYTLEQLLREEEEFLKLQMYLRDDRFLELEKDPSLRGQLHKTILDMLHCPMRTNEKVLTLLYGEVLQGAHKAQASTVLNELTPIIRRLGSLGDLWTHKFEDDSTKVLQKFKLPYDQSRKIFAVSQLHGLREAVYVAIPPSEKQLRQDWMDFLHEYVHINALLHSTNDYSTADMDRLEKHIDVCFNLLVSRIGGAERGVTNYFHYMGSGHLMWLVRRYGNLWRFCNEGVESLNSVVSKRYNQFNNKGGNKQAHQGGPKKKCLPFECIGRWLGRLSCWHTGLAVDYFQDLAWDLVDWTPNSKTVWNPLHDCYDYTVDVCTEGCIELDTDWEVKTPENDEQIQEDDAFCFVGDYMEDVSWMDSTEILESWSINSKGHKTSTRIRFQNRPVVV